jgi:cytochrome c peroxidase
MAWSQQILRIVCLAFIVLLSSCTKDSEIVDDAEFKNIPPRGFPAVVYPVDNEFTYQRWALGKQLFYDKRLSKSNTISCANCHLAAYAFSDTLARSVGDNNSIGRGNAPSLANLAYHPYFTRAGGVPTLEQQVLVPVQEHDEFNTNMIELVAELKQDAAYVQAAQLAYARELDAYVVTRAIANFERSFFSGNSRYDEYAQHGNRYAMSTAELRGQVLFMSERTHCASCHSGFNFTNYLFENNGLYEVYADSGRMRLTLQEGDRARFKVPSLRNVALTAPYMHDGSLSSLDAVVAHYNLGGKLHHNKSALVRPLNLSKIEQQDLIAFLRSLTDNEFVTNRRLQQ